ncbi:F-box/WD repeat-containing protein 9 [Tulasnella sp. JGI-2019a]|nr:F-box/WD repeat-containing protein 9 [Tulasnella sp. JGI-2019a]
MLAEPKCHDPEELLNALLSTASGSRLVFEHNSNLDSIYSRILIRACPPDSTIVNLFRDVLGTLCVLVDPVNIHTLTSLIYPDRSDGKGFTNDIRTKVLAYLQAVLIIPDVDEEDSSRDAKPIRFIHKSFQDHLMDESRCDARFLVDISEQHRRMAIRCLRHMEDLRKPNICDIDPTMLNNKIGRDDGESDNQHTGDYDDRDTGRPSNDAKEGNGEHVRWDNADNVSSNSTGNKEDERPNIKALIQRHIPLALQYACTNWTTHVSHVSSECDDVYMAMDIFVKTRLLYWRC